MTQAHCLEKEFTVTPLLEPISFNILDLNFPEDFVFGDVTQIYKTLSKSRFE